MQFAMRSFPLLLTSFSLFSFSFFLRLLLLSPLWETPVCEISAPQYFGEPRRYMEKKQIFYRSVTAVPGVEYSLFVFRLLLLTHFWETPEAENFRPFFLLFAASIQSRPPGPPLVPGVFKVGNGRFRPPFSL